MKILKWFSIVIAVIVITFSATVLIRQNRKFSVPYPRIQVSTDSVIIKRGKHLVIGPAHCISCHGSKSQVSEPPAEPDLSGGIAFNIPIGTICTPNLTPGEGGISKLTDKEIARALRYGVRPDGTAMIDFMSFHNTSDEDLQAIISYLRQARPVNKIVPKTNFNILGKIINAFVFAPVYPIGEPPVSIKKDSSIAYGRYLASSVANCHGCHTNRNLMTGEFTGMEYAGGLEMESDGDSATVVYTTPNLTTGYDSKIKNWTLQQFITRFRIGRVLKESHMPWESFSRMDDTELTAIYRYLKSLPPVSSGIKHYVKFKKK